MNMQPCFRKGWFLGPLVLAMAIILVVATGPVLAQEEGDIPSEETGSEEIDAAIDNEGPSFQNHSQLQHAENVAAASAAKAEQDAADAVADSEKKGEMADEAYDYWQGLVAGGTATAEEIAAAEEAYNEAQAAYEAAQENADDKLANIAGVSVDEIAAMRAEMGWGEICHELGLHPSILGHGHTKTKGWKDMQQEELSAEVRLATKRNLKTGEPKGHGLSDDKNNGNANGDKGKLLAPGQNKDKDNGKDKDKSNNGKGKDK
jgi:hypothetical protein